jgi:hypothetical protein
VVAFAFVSSFRSVEFGGHWITRDEPQPRPY